MMNNLGLYIHIPFCQRKCNYCDFYSLSGCLELQEEYIAAVTRQLEALSGTCRDKVVDSIYVGGGTPSLIRPMLLKRLLERIRENYRVDSQAEVTVEANPATVYEEGLGVYLEAGINRISFGIQSCNDRTLQRLGRLHGFDEAEKSVILARRAGFVNISGDLMYALPGQTCEQFLLDVQKVASLPLTHISMYGLKVEENTPFGRDGTLSLPGEEEQCEMYLEGTKQLASFGFSQYEISNFSRKGYESRHNLKYWTRDEYLGFGPSAHSFFENTRFFLPRDLKKYLSAGDYTLSSPLYEGRQKISFREAEEEEVLLSLRMTRGCSVALLDRIVSEKNALSRYLRMLEKEGLATVKENCLGFTPRGMLLSNSIISDLLLL